MPCLEDSEIVALYWQRSETAIGETSRKYGGYCTSIAKGVLHDAQDAEECVNDTWLRAWNAMPPQRPGKLAAFLGKITRNLSIDRLLHRSAKKRGGGEAQAALEELQECVPSPATVESESDNHALAAALDRFLAGLPANTRTLFLRRYWYMMPIRTIAAQLGMNENTAASTLMRTRRALKQYLEQEGIEL
ncbi:MAG: RNA polymerase sigma factor [Gemmiger sp.]